MEDNYQTSLIYRTGALYVRNPGADTPLHPTFFGGGQERNFRPGTENTGMIAGLGHASQLVVDNLEQYHDDMKMVSSRIQALGQQRVKPLNKSDFSLSSVSSVLICLFVC